MADYILAIDPGNNQSAYCLIDQESLRPLSFEIIDNQTMLNTIEVLGMQFDNDYELAIEMVRSYGMKVGGEVFETVFWIGRFYEAAASFQDRTRVYRMDVKMHICHDSRANDSNIRQALIDRFGPVGMKAKPGWFYGFKKDLWQAYAVGVTYAETRENTCAKP